MVMTGDIDPDVHKAVLKLDEAKGLSGFPGIVMVADHQGRIIEATEAAVVLQVGLDEDTSGIMAGLVARAHGTGPMNEPVTLSDGSVFDLAVLPLGQGGRWSSAAPRRSIETCATP